jgi:hypothetical protein
VTDIRKSDDRPAAQPDGTDAQPIVIRKLDRLETTRGSNPSGS